MFNNPRTTIMGYLAIAAAVVAFLTKFFQGQPVSLDEALALIGVIGGGAAAVNAKDGGH